jgi:Ca2+-binding EF-hand superfamily protein
MRDRFRFFVAVAFFFLPWTAGQAQFPGGDGGGGPPGGGGRRFGGDPNQFFDRLSGGKDVIRRSELPDPRMQMMFDRWAERLGITNGEITRDQFTTMMQNFRGMRGGRNGANPGGGGPPGGGTAPGGEGDRTAGWAEAMFRQLDQNGDGVLNYDEMPEALRAERDKWDTDKNGLIDLNEFKAYFQARVQQFLIDRGGQGGFGWPGNGADPGQDSATPAPEPEKRPVVYRFGNLPKELPAWFQQLDTDQDGQIGLYEWKAAGRPIAEFLKMDRNSDGFLTVEEVLRYQAQNKTSGGGTAVSQYYNPGNSSSNGQDSDNRTARNANSNSGNGGGRRDARGRDGNRSVRNRRAPSQGPSFPDD